MNVVTESDLSNTLSELSIRIRSSNEENAHYMCAQLSKAEYSLVHELCKLAAVYLTGASVLEGNVGFVSVGDVRDTCDTIELGAYELRITREEAEEILEETCRRYTDGAHRALAAGLVEIELEGIQRLRETEMAKAEEMTKGLSVIFADIQEVLVGGLKSAGVAPNRDVVVLCGARTQARIEEASCRWLQWMTNKATTSDDGGATHRTRSPLEVGGAELGPLMAVDMGLSQLVLAIKRAMQLRRQQIRMAALLRRVATCRSCCDAIDNVEANVVV
jgi:hypothetical protein